jgi:hypothetical protein
MNRLFLTLSLAVVAAIAPASAATVILDNSSAHPGGTWTFGTAANPGPAVLTNGVIDTVTKIDGSVFSLPVTGTCGLTGSYGCINFTTGSFISEMTMGSTTTYQYGPGGSLSITGMADGASGLLYSTAGFAGVVTLNVNNTTNLASLSALLGSGDIDPVLASILGIAPFTPGGTDANSAFQITFRGGLGTGNASTNSVQLEAGPPVPEPASMVLMGAGLVAIAGTRLRKRVQRVSE